MWPTGNSPIAPGTVSSLLASVIGYFININFGSDITFCISILSGLVGYSATKIYTKHISNKDPQEVVIDDFPDKCLRHQLQEHHLL